MRCPVCKHSRTRIIRTRPDPESEASDRVRICQSPSCHAIFNSREMVVSIIENSQDSCIPPRSP